MITKSVVYIQYKNNTSYILPLCNLRLHEIEISKMNIGFLDPLMQVAGVGGKALGESAVGVSTLDGSAYGTINSTESLVNSRASLQTSPTRPHPVAEGVLNLNYDLSHSDENFNTSHIHKPV